LTSIVTGGEPSGSVATWSLPEASLASEAGIRTVSPVMVAFPTTSPFRSRLSVSPLRPSGTVTITQ